MYLKILDSLKASFMTWVFNSTEPKETRRQTNAGISTKLLVLDLTPWSYFRLPQHGFSENSIYVFSL